MKMQHNNILLTIVVPVFNSGKYLPATLNSIISQYCNAVEIILVNDGSTDCFSGKICEEYSSKYSYIRYIEQDNRKLGGARNTGLAAACSRFIMFLDSDDILCSCALSSMLRVLCKYDVPLLILEPLCFDTHTFDCYKWYDTDIRCTIPKNTEICAREFTSLYEFEVSACMRLYSVDFLKAIVFKFPEHVFYEDFFCHFLHLHLAHSCVVTDINIFMYRTGNATSITSNKGLMRLDQLLSFKEAIDYSNSNFSEDIESKLIKKILHHATWIIGQSENTVRIQFIRGLASVLKNTSYRSFKHLTLLDKMKFVVMKNTTLSLMAQGNTNRLKRSKYIVDKILNFCCTCNKLLNKAEH